MPSVDILIASPIKRTPRVIQVEGQFDLTPEVRRELRLKADLPLGERPWRIGAFVGPSGSGKSTLLKGFFGEPTRLDWDSEAAIIDAFPKGLPVQAVTSALSSVGFSSPPAWLRPFQTLSNGEQFRAQVARLLIESPDPIIIDEFTSVVDRTVARIGAAAIAGHIRKRTVDRRLVVASCHEDIVDWLQPDWLYETGGNTFTWRSLQQRPKIRLNIYRSTSEAWRWFRQYHYLSDRYSPVSYCLVATVEGKPAAMSAAIPQMGFAGIRREHRVVVLPDFQGVGIGNKLSEFHGAYWKAKGHRFHTVTSHPAIVHYRAASPLWWMTDPPRIKDKHGRKDGRKVPGSEMRFTASFEYIGPALSRLEASTLD